MTHGPFPSGATPLSDAEWEAVARYLAGESTPEEGERIRHLLAGRPADRALLEMLDRSLRPVAREESTPLDAEHALRLVTARRRAEPLRSLAPLMRTLAPRPPAPRWHVAVPAIAAAVVLAAGLVLWKGGRAGVPVAVAAAVTRTTAAGERDSLRLADGTLVVLAPETRVVVAAGYGAPGRTVDVRGEAWFLVQHDDARPFVVHAGAATVRDIGTAFSVRERGDDSVVVVVSEGTVLMHPSASADSGVILHAGDAGVMSPNGEIDAQRGGAQQATVVWSRGTLAFRDATMKEVAAEFQRSFGIVLRFGDSTVAARRLSATFTSESADQMLDIMRIALGAELERRGDTVTVRSSIRGTIRSR